MSKFFRVKIFFSNACADNVLESHFGYPLSVRDTYMVTWSAPDTIFDVWKKSCQIMDFGQKSPGEPSECPGGLKSKNVIIWCLKPFGSVQIDAFSYRSRYHMTSRSEVRKPKKKFWIFNSLLFSLLLALNGSTEDIKWRRHGRFWATWGPCVMTP